MIREHYFLEFSEYEQFYTLTGDTLFEVSSVTSNTSLLDISERFRAKKYSGIEFYILLILKTYRYINIYNLNILLKKVMYGALLKDDYSYNVKRLFLDGLLEKHTYSKKVNNSRSLVAYSLSELGYKYIVKSNKGIKTYTYKPYEEFHTQKVMEYLSLVQWHVNVINHGFKGYFMLKKAYLDTYVTLPSYIKFKSSKGLNMGIIAIPAVKNISNEIICQSFGTKIIRCLALINDKNDEFSHTFIVFIVDSFDTSCKIYDLLTKEIITKNLPILYVLDRDTHKKGCALERLYHLEVEEGRYEVHRFIV